MTDQVTSPAPASPSADTQQAIAAIFHQKPIEREMAPVQQILGTSTEQAQAPNPASTDPASATNQMQPPQALQAGLAPDGQAAQTADARTQAPNMVPGSRLKEEADRRRAAEQQLRDMERRFAEMQGYVQGIQTQPQQPVQQTQPQQPADPHPLPPQFKSPTDYMIADPDGYTVWLENRAAARAQQAVAEQTSRVQSELRQVAWQADDMRAQAKYGPDYVNRVKEYVKANPQLSNHFSQFADPYSRAAEWARQEEVRRAIPDGDIQAARTQWLRDALANPEVLKIVAPHLTAQQPSPVPQSVPPSLGAMPRAMGTGPVMDTKDAIEAMFNSRRAG